MGWWVLPAAASSLVLAAIFAAILVRRPLAPLWPVILLVPASGFLWSIGELVSASASDAGVLWLGLALLYTGSIWIGPAVWIGALRYAELHGMRPARLGRSWERAAVACGLALWVAMLTNPWHGHFVTPVVGDLNPYHEGFLLLVVVGYAEVLGAVWLCLRFARRHAQRDVRRSGSVFAVALLAPLAANAAFIVSGWYAAAHFTGVALAGAAALLGSAMYGTRQLWLLPIAVPEILRHDPTGAVMIGRSGRVLYWNPAAERMLAALPLSLELEIWSALAAFLRAENGEAVEALELERDLERASPDGRSFRAPGAPDARLRLATVPVPGRRGRRAATVLRIDDVSAAVRAERDRRALEEQLRRSEHLRSLAVLAGGLAHDFNNRLTAILGNAELALQRAAPESSMRPFLEAIEDTSLRAADLTQQLLCYAGQAPSFRRTTDLSNLVNETRPLLEAALARGAILEVMVHETLPVEADPAQIRQVLVNLVANATEAMAEAPGHVTVRTGSLEIGRAGAASAEVALQPGRYAFVEVSDSGPGMDEQTRRHAFEPFFSTRFLGRGLGLAAAQGIVRAHGGEVCLESQPERGSTFRVLLPLVTREAAARPPAPGPRRAAPDWRGTGTALLVEDEGDVRAVATSMLEGMGFRVLAAGSGRAALSLFQAHTREVRFVLLDLTLPDVASDELVEALRRLSPGARILGSSSYGQESWTDRLPSTKIDGFVRKPYGMGALRAALRRLLEGPA